MVVLLVTIGVAAFMFPRIREINGGVVNAGGFFGIAHGIGIWAIGAGVITGLLAAASGWGSAKRTSI